VICGDCAAGAAGCGGPVPSEGADVVAGDRKVLGVDPATVHRALGAGDSAGADDAEELVPVRGRDVKTYPRRRRQQPAIACSTCGELHEESPDECPWDLWAQGLGPRPVRQGAVLEGPSHDRNGADVVVEKPPEETEGVAAGAHPARV